MQFFQRLWKRVLRFGTNKKLESLPVVETKSTEGFASPGETEAFASRVERKKDWSHYGLPSPPRGELARADPEDAIEAMKEDGFELKDLKIDERKVLFFLYGRGFYSNRKKKKRIAAINKIIKKRTALKHAVRLVTSCGDKDVTEKCQVHYSNLSKSLDRYFEQPGAFGLHSFTGALKYYFRRQQQGNCFLLAPCVGIAYLMQMKGVADAAPLDLTQFVRHSFHDDKLLKYLAKDAGGDTLKEFEAMLKDLSEDVQPVNIRPRIRNPCEFNSVFSLEDILREHGPGIVSNFKAHKRFGKRKKGEIHVGDIGYYQYHGKKIHCQGKFIHLTEKEEERGEVEVILEDFDNLVPTILEPVFNSVDDQKEGDDESGSEGVEVSEGTSVSHGEAESAASEEGESMSQTDGKDKMQDQHAMLLIGGRLDRNNRLWFLLQNTWEEMHLVEVSKKYLEASGATIAFAPPEYKFAPASKRKNFSLNSALYADANNFDRAVQTEDGLSPPNLDRIDH